MSNKDTKIIYEIVKRFESELTDEEKHSLEKLSLVVRINDARDEENKLYNELNNLSAEENKEIKK